jgi:hypothetical protein
MMRPCTSSARRLPGAEIPDAKQPDDAAIFEEPSLASYHHTSQSAQACRKPSSGSRVGMNSWPTCPL